MIPASCAVASASPFGSSRSRAVVPGDIRTSARATARRRDKGLAPTSTMRTEPDASCRLRDEVEPVEDRVHEQSVALLVRGDRLREVVRNLEVDREPAFVLKTVVDGARLPLDRGEVFRVLRNVLARRIE